MKRIIALGLCLLSLNAWAQLDEVRKLITEQKSLPKEQLAGQSFKIAQAYYQLGEFQQAIKYSRKSIKEARQNKDSLQHTKSLGLICEQFIEVNQIDSCYIRLFQLEELSTVYPSAANLSCYIGTKLWSKLPGSNPFLKCFNELVNQGRLNKPEDFVLAVEANQVAGQLDQALAYAFKGAASAKENQNLPAQLQFNVEVAKMYSTLNQDESALTQLKQYLQDCQEQEFKLGLVRAKLLEGQISSNFEGNGKVRKILADSYNQIDSTCSPELISEIYSTYAMSLASRRTARQGVQLAMEALDIAERINNPYYKYLALKAASRNYAVLSFGESFIQYDELAVKTLEELKEFEINQAKLYFNQLVSAQQVCYRNEIEKSKKEVQLAKSELELARSEEKTFSYLFYFVVVILFTTILMFIYSRSSENQKK